MNNTVTIFKSITDVSAGFNRDVFIALERIRDGKSKELVEQVRKLPKEKADHIKRNLPGVCFNGSFRHRKVSGLIQHSGLMIIDIDKFESEKLAIECKNTLAKDPFIFSCWISPSGVGVKALVQIPREPDNHKYFFESFRDHINHDKWDNSGSDVARLCFESYDPDIYINPDSEIWSTKETPDICDIGTDRPVIAITSESVIITNLVEWWNKKYGANKGSRNTNIFKLAAAFNDFGVKQSDAEYTLKKFEDVDFNESEILNIVKSAYRKIESHNTKFFEDEHSKVKIEKFIRNGKGDKDIAKEFPEIESSKIETYVNSVKESLDIEEFWEYNDNDKIKLNAYKFKYWLQQNSFFKFYPSDISSTFSFIKRDQHLLEETNEKRIKDFTLDYMLNKNDDGYRPFNFMATNSGYFRQDFLSMIDTMDIKVKEDTRDICYIYYKNCVLEVTADEIKEIDYIDIDGFVWKRQIIDREFRKFNDKDSIFSQFIWRVCGESEDKYYSFVSVIGYLMHSFKTSADNKAIIFNDETISENPNGGSGKGLFWNALKYMKKVSIIDGKSFEHTKSFPYQTVSTDTQILVFDDVKKNFSFESLFSLITEGITLEYKGQDAIQIPVEKSPKILITTNYTIGGVGGSHERRKFEIEMSSYFSSRHTPLDEFGHMLFSDWDNDEWLRFDNYMVGCEQYYLKHGLVSHKFNNLEVRKLIKETSNEFYEWAKDGAMQRNTRIDKSMAFNEFVDEYPDMKKWLTQRRFTKWIETYGEFKGYKVESGKSNHLRWIMIIDPKSEETL